MAQQFKALEHHLDHDEGLRKFVDAMLVDMGMVEESRDGRVEWK